jgi:adenylosuccinate synthase
MAAPGKFHILLDGGHGSSGKGAAVARIADVLGVPNVSGNNGPNAGHYVQYDRPGDPAEPSTRILYKAVPSAAALYHPRSPMGDRRRPRLWIGPNSAFALEQLRAECEILPPGALEIHGRAAILAQHHKDMEGPGGAFCTEHISSTMSGAGGAYASKAMRQLDTQLAEEVRELDRYTRSARGFYEAVQERLGSGESFLHEVAQGFPLSLDYGTHARHCTYRNVSAQQAAADMGVRPEQVGEVYLNLRTFPIRVGNNYKDGVQVGYSGDWEEDQIELSWDQVGAAAGMPPEEVARLYSSELTSVTKKLRRVATFSYEGTKYAARFNGATALVLNFTSYLDWATRGAKSMRGLSAKVTDFGKLLEDEVGLPVVMYGTGAEHSEFVLPYGARGLADPKWTQN